MTRKFSIAVLALLCSLSVGAQNVTGGVKGTVQSRSDRTPVQGAKLTLFNGAQQIAEGVSSQDGTFFIPNLENGMYTLVISNADFLETRVNVTVNDGYVKNMFTLSLTPAKTLTDNEENLLNEFDLDDTGYNDSPTLLFASNDPFANVTSYNFSAVRFRERGYASESRDVYLAGIRLNDALTGYAPFSLWSGLNEATRSKETSIGLDGLNCGFGGYSGATNVLATPSSMRAGLRGRVLTNSAFYRLNLALSYSTGLMDNGWALSANVSTRLGNNDWVEGVYYKSFAYYLGAEKKFNESNRLAFMFMASPGERGAQNASTQEVYDLVGSNFYNSNWGLQRGQMRNARVRKTHEPIAVVKYSYTPSVRFGLDATVLYRFGKNGYTALDWYDSADPRPDYYRNLPSYFYSENADLDRLDSQKSFWAREAWTSGYAKQVHVDWDHLYAVNYANVNENGFRRSKYVQEERHTDQNDFNYALTMKWKPSDSFTLNGGINGRFNCTEYYKTIADLLGGDYFLDIDNFAERDFASSMAKVQNDLDYYLKSGNTRLLEKGDKYGYDYNAHVQNIEAWLKASFATGNFSGNVAARVGHESLWREGLVRKGLFAGLDSKGNDFIVDGVNLTTRDSYGDPITSYGDSKHLSYLTYAVKGGLNYNIGSSMRVYANAGYFTEAPRFNKSFLSPRTRNSVVPGLELKKTFSGDVNYQYSKSGYNFRVTGYYTKIDDQSDVMSFYDDAQSAFSNFALSNIDERHVGIEFGFAVPMPVSGLSLEGALAWGEHVYTSTPYMTQTVDNSSEVVIDHQLVPYWKSHPVFKTDELGNKTMVIDHYQRHYVPSTPQLAASLGLDYNYKYWYISLNGNYFANNYLSMNPLYRTDMATSGADRIVTPDEIEYMAAQEKFDPAFLLNASIGKSWFIHNRQLGFSFQINNILNNRNMRNGGYEQTRLIDNTKSGERYYRFDPKYFYLCGINYMLNIYFKF